MRNGLKKSGKRSQNGWKKLDTRCSNIRSIITGYEKRINSKLESVSYKHRLPISFLQATNLQIQMKPKTCKRRSTKINLNKGIYKNKAKNGFPDRCCSKSENKCDRDIFHAKAFTSDAIKIASNFFYHLCDSQYAGVK